MTEDVILLLTLVSAPHSLAEETHVEESDLVASKFEVPASLLKLTTRIVTEPRLGWFLLYYSS
jgi:hypothetical protein